MPEPSVYVWFEGETPVSANFKYWTGEDRPGLLSAGKVLGTDMDAEAQKAMPQGGTSC